MALGASRPLLVIGLRSRKMTHAAQPSDDHLVSLSKDGDLAAFNSLVDRHQTAVYNLCYRIVGTREAAEDAAQEAFLSAYRALPRFAGGNFRSWLLRIAANQSRDELRRRKRKDRASSLDRAVDEDSTPTEIPDVGETPVTRAERVELSGVLQHALNRLSSDQRQVVTLIDVFDYRYEEVAEILDVSVGTVKSRVHRARGKLREYLGAHAELLAGYRRLDG